MRLLTTLIALLAFPAVAVAQNVVVVAEPTTIGVEPTAAAAFADLLRGELSKQAGFTVVGGAQTPQEPCGEASCAPALAAQTNANGVVVIALSQLGNKIIVQVGYTDANGQPRWSDRATAAKLDDLEPLAKRVAVGVATGKPLSDTITTSTVTEEEAKPEERRKAMFTSGVRLGVLVPVAGAYGGADFMTNFGIFGMFEVAKYAFTLEGDIAWTPGDDNETEAVGASFDMGGRFFLDPEADTGTYLGGGLGFRLVAVTTKDAIGSTVDGDEGGLGLFAGGGAVFLRTSDFHILVDARYTLNLFQFELAGDKTTSHGVMVTVGFSYSNWGFGRRGLW